MPSPTVIPFAERVQRLAKDLAIEQRHQRDSAAHGRSVLPIREYTGHPPRSIYDWVAGGQVKPGHEVNGLALPDRVVETLGQPDPPQYVVVGEERYSDGRWYLDFAVSEAWVSAQRPPCEECGGTGGHHVRVDFEDPKTHKVRKVRCPNAPMVRR